MIKIIDKISDTRSKSLELHGIFRVMYIMYFMDEKIKYQD